MKVEKEINSKREVFHLKPLTHKQLAEMYGVSWLTFQNWMRKVEHEVGKKTGHFYHIHQVKKIFQLFGLPKTLNITNQDEEEIFKT
jgi:transposase